MDMNFYGAKTYKRNKTIFIALPRGAQRPITGGCQCSWCKAHPGTMAMWDTLAVSCDGKGGAWTVHYPDIPA